MGLALSSSHHYSSQPRVRAQSDRHSSSNALQLILVNVLKKQQPKTKVSEILIRASLQAITALGIFLKVDILSSAMWNMTLHLKAASPAPSTAPPFLTYALNPSLLCVLCLDGTCTDTQLFYCFHTGKTTRNFFKPSKMKVLFTRV